MQQGLASIPRRSDQRERLRRPCAPTSTELLLREMSVAILATIVGVGQMRSLGRISFLGQYRSLTFHDPDYYVNSASEAANGKRALLASKKASK